MTLSQKNFSSLNVTLQDNVQGPYMTAKFWGLITSVFDGEPRHAQRGIRSECQEETVTTALDSLWGLVALETC